jgi:CheY-like chemotaxis protein
MDPFRILLVDPVEDDRELQAIVLRKAGFVVLEGDNPLRMAITERPDAIVIDVTPKRLGAAEFVERVKADERTAHIPVVIVSTYPQPDLPASEGFVCKPNGPGALLDELARVLPISTRSRP